MKSQPATSRLADLGIDKTQSSRWQKLAELSQDDFDDKVGRAVGKAITALDRAEKERNGGKLAKPPGGSNKRPRKDRGIKNPDHPTLEARGIDKNLAKEAQAHAAQWHRHPAFAARLSAAACARAKRPKPVP
jgi:hypothetical protein